MVDKILAKLFNVIEIKIADKQARPFASRQVLSEFICL